MRLLGIFPLLLALWGLGYGWFALAWDGGTQRVAGDWALIGLSALLGIGAIAAIAGQRWGWILCGLVVAGCALLFLGIGISGGFTP